MRDKADRGLGLAADRRTACNSRSARAVRARSLDRRGTLARRPDRVLRSDRERASRPHPQVLARARQCARRRRRRRAPHRRSNCDARSTMSACWRSRCSWSPRVGRQALLVNEIAPRVHNSGHWTIDGATVSQFEQHVRAVAGWPLAKPLRHGRIEMTNLIGAEVEDYARWLTVPGASVHLYGKGAPRPGRKMGHVTQVFPDRPGVTRPWGGVDPERRLATRSAWAGKAAARSPNSDGRSPPAGGLRRLILLQAQLIGSPRVALWRGSAGSGTSRTIQEPQQRNDACRFSSVTITSIRPSKR